MDCRVKRRNDKEFIMLRLPLCPSPMARFTSAMPIRHCSISTSRKSAAGGFCCGSRTSTRSAASRSSRRRSTGPGLARPRLGNAGPRRSEHFGEYRCAWRNCSRLGLVYRASKPRRDRKAGGAAAGGCVWLRDPDGAPLYPVSQRLSPSERTRLISRARTYALGSTWERRSRARRSAWTEQAKARRRREQSPPPQAWADVSWRARRRRPADHLRL